jgi:predicted RNA-binding protein
MCQATVLLASDGQEEEIMRDVILLEPVANGVRLVALFEEPQTVRARIQRIDFLKHAVTLVPEAEEEEQDGGHDRCAEAEGVVTSLDRAQR